jgi:Fe-S-cluster-containing dehydrogenase component
MSRTVQVETRLSLTGSNADERMRVLPSEQRNLVLALAVKIAAATGAELGVTATGNAQIDKIAKDLLANKGKSLVVTDSDDLAVQGAVAFINEQLGNYGKTLDLNSHLQSNLADDAEIAKLLAEVKSGAVTGLILVGVNPAYDSATPGAWAEAIKKAAVSIAVSQRADETAKLCKIMAASNHALESWGDLETVAGTLTLQQPLVNPLFETRQAEDSLLLWADAKVAGKPATILPFMQEIWQQQVAIRAGKPADFLKFWDKTVHDGYVVVGRETVVIPGGPSDVAPPQPVPASADASPVAAPADVSAVALPVAATLEVKLEAPIPALYTLEGVKKALATPAAKVAGEGKFELVLFPTVALRFGQQANNPFLHELPDPITKSTWGNYACVSPKTAAAMGVGSSDVVAVTAGGATVELPVVLSPGLHDGAIALPLGFGRTAVGKIGDGLGKDVRVLAPTGSAVKCDVSKTGKQDPVAFSQIHHSYEHRDSVRETSFAEWSEDPKAGNETLEASMHDKGKGDKRVTRSLWNRHEYPGHKWGMAIDMNKCTGCGACVVSCNIENNVPVVGKEEVLLRREMHWLRIDRYFSERSTPEGYDWDSTKDDLLALADNPEVVHMPMLCQHCDNAPCETVCPVLATVHSSEGLNTQAYNRCIGTRYCANNCPYKVRRFNWFNYPHGDMEGKQEKDLVALALNPDITKRSRGVMEKCTFCVQRIQEVKALASREGRVDINANGQICKPDEVKTACQQSCPAEAITFGDMNAESQVKKQYDDPRNYSALVEIGTQPAVTYMTKVRNYERVRAAKHEKHEKKEHGAAHKAEG